MQLTIKLPPRHVTLQRTYVTYLLVDSVLPELLALNELESDMLEDAGLSIARWKPLNRPPPLLGFAPP
eukprot:24220-Eustigmatos_ZCMA.PRE.1